LFSNSNKTPLSVDELFSLIERSSLPTVLVEGDDDIIIFRRLEQLLRDKSVSVQPTGGRSALLKLFSRRSQWKNAPLVLFIADRDIWVYSDVPSEYKSDDLIFTDGYSIENDAFRDGNFLKLMDENEKNKFFEELRAFLFWYTHCLSKTVSGGEEDALTLKTHPNTVLDSEPSIVEVCRGNTKDDAMKEMYEMVLNDYDKLVRGKSLIAILMRHISYKGRAASHRHAALLDQVGAAPGPFLRAIFSAVEQRFA
jgi:hypothetical protein